MLFSTFIGLRNKPEYLAQAHKQLEEARARLIQDRIKFLKYATFYTPEEVNEELNRIDRQIGSLTRSLSTF